MAEAKTVTIKDVHMAFHRAEDCIKIVQTVRQMGNHQAQTNYDEAWRQKFDDKANDLVTILAQELGANWHQLAYDTALPAKAQNAFEEVRKLLPN